MTALYLIPAVPPLGAYFAAVALNGTWLPTGGVR